MVTEESPRGVSKQAATLSDSFLRCQSLFQVSWLRRRDQHILAVGDFKYVADDRFRAFYSAATDTWMLQIKSVKKSDAGSYECQIPTTPKKSHRLDVDVIGAFVSISKLSRPLSIVSLRDVNIFRNFHCCTCISTSFDDKVS